MSSRFKLEVHHDISRLKARHVAGLPSHVGTLYHADEPFSSSAISPRYWQNANQAKVNQGENQPEAMLLKHVELSKEDADVIHQSVLEVDETASKDLRSNARSRTCTGSAIQSAQKLIADQQHRQ